MSLLGRLEDLSLTDIVQIVYLSRRTGVLEIVNQEGRHTVLFRHGLIVNASAPSHLDLVSYLVQQGLVPEKVVEIIRKMEEGGIPAGTTALEMNVVSPDDLSNAIRDRILGVVTPLLHSREGEFNFLLSETMSAVHMEYDPDTLFKDGGFAPQKMLGGADGEKLKPLRGLEESLKAGKALLRGASGPAVEVDAAPDAPVAVPGPESVPPPPQVSSPPPTVDDDVAALPVGMPEGPGRAKEPPPTPASVAAGKFKVAGGLFEVESPEAAFRNVVLYERNPLIRVAAKRAFAKHGVKIFQFGSLDDTRGAMTDLFRANSFFVTFLELTHDDASVRLLQQLKRRNARLPVVIVDHEADLRRRHDILRAGADLYLTKPSPARLQPGLAEEELTLFADELVLFAERSFKQWEQLTGGGIEAGKKFYEMVDRENVDRSFGLLKQLINELSDPDDIDQVSTTMLRMAGEYVDRGALFMVTEDHFIGLGGFGVTGKDEEMMPCVRRLRIVRSEPSILAEVAASREVHRGKMRKTAANVQLIEAMGGLLPTETIALPIMQGDRAIGILYGDNAEHRAPIDKTAGLEIFLSQAGYAFGNAVFAAQKTGFGREGL